MIIILPSWLGSYYGSALSFEEYEYRTLKKIPAEKRRVEVACLKTKWFDYVRLHPLQATYYFAECYRRIYCEISKKYYGNAEARGTREDIMESREATGFWMARQFCDVHGYEYSWFIRHVINLRLSGGDFKQRIPRPCHLVSDNIDELKAIDDAWIEKFDGTTIKHATDPYFCVASWRGTTEQRSHEDFIVGQIKMKRVKHYAVGECVYRLQMLRFERACIEFPDEIAYAQKIIACSYHSAKECS